MAKGPPVPLEPCSKCDGKGQTPNVGVRPGQPTHSPCSSCNATGNLRKK